LTQSTPQLNAPNNATPITNALTVDVEEYFQVSGFEDVIPRSSWDTFETRVERSTDRLLDVFSRTDVTATFFALGWTAERHPDLIRRIRAAGHEVGCHSYAHRLVYQCSPDEFREDTRRAKGILEDILGEPVVGYRAPSFSITAKSLWALEILVEEGFQYDSSIFPVYRDRYGIPAAPRRPFKVVTSPGSSTTAERSIMEFPLATVRTLGVNLPIGGGGYLRLVPDWVFYRAIGRVVEKDRVPAVLYIHPWELDPDQPRIRSGSWLSRFRHTVNLHTAEQKLTALLHRWRFRSIAVVLEGMQPVPGIDLDRIAATGRT